jgi:hypothetical protein
VHLYRRLVTEEFSIGIFAGPSPTALAPRAGALAPVMTRQRVSDQLATFVADPFMVHVDGAWHMFFEVMNWRPGARKGEIAWATSADAARWQYQGIVLEEPFHLSYPYVFRAGADFFMIPETSSAGEVRLYRADPFPQRWKLEATLLTGRVHLDSSVFEWGGSWWMLSETDHRRGTLRLFRAPCVTGPWTEHPRSPVVGADPRISRPAGRVLVTGGRIIRYAQDCRDRYGSRVFALEITTLDPERYEERDLLDGPVLAGSGSGWNARGMHHVDAHPLPGGGWIACVDGWFERFRTPTEILRWGGDRIRERLAPAGR